MKVEAVTRKFENALGGGITLHALSQLVSNLDRLALFFTGIYGSSESNAAGKMIGGAKALAGYELAKSPNLPASAAGIAWTTATFIAASNKALKSKIRYK